MEGMLLTVFLAFLFGAMLLMLVFGYQTREQERAARRGAAEVGTRALEGRRFFANLEAGSASALESPATALLVERLEARLRLEHEGAAGFARQPSAEGLGSGFSAQVDAVASALERYIEHECASSAAFVAEPSVEGLFRTPGLPLGLAQSLGRRPPTPDEYNRRAC